VDLGKGQEPVEPPEIVPSSRAKKKKNIKKPRGKKNKGSGRATRWGGGKNRRGRGWGEKKFLSRAFWVHRKDEPKQTEKRRENATNGK